MIGYIIMFAVWLALLIVNPIAFSAGVALIALFFGWCAWYGHYWKELDRE